MKSGNPLLNRTKFADGADTYITPALNPKLNDTVLISPMHKAEETCAIPLPIFVTPAVKKILADCAFNARQIKKSECDKLDDVVVACWEGLEIFDRYQIEEKTLRHWLTELKEGYDEKNPHTNYASAVQWTHMTHFMLVSCNLRPIFRSVDVFGLLCLILSYGVTHPGIQSPTFNPYAVAGEALPDVSPTLSSPDTFLTYSVLSSQDLKVDENELIGLHLKRLKHRLNRELIGKKHVFQHVVSDEDDNGRSELTELRGRFEVLGDDCKDLFMTWTSIRKHVDFEKHPDRVTALRDAIEAIMDKDKEDKKAGNQGMTLSDSKPVIESQSHKGLMIMRPKATALDGRDMSLLLKMLMRGAYIGCIMKPFGAGKQNIQLLMCEMLRSSKLQPPLHRTLMEQHLQHLVKDCTPLFACFQTLGLGNAAQLAFHFDPAVVISAAQSVRSELNANKEVCGMPYALVKRKMPITHKNVYSHEGHRKFTNTLGSIPTVFQNELDASKKAEEDKRKAEENDARIRAEERRKQFVLKRFGGAVDGRLE